MAKSPKDKAQELALKWLQTKGDQEKGYLVSCGSLGVMSAKHKDNKWQIEWFLATEYDIIVLSDLIHKIEVAPQTTPYACEKCGRKFGKRFALTNHQKSCSNETKQE